MSKKLYDVLKYIQRLALPAMATLYMTLSGIWALPYGEQISASVMAVDTFLGVLLGLTKSSYNRGAEEAVKG